MVYSNKLVACVKVDGQILREQGETVTVPFGSEYSIYLKNLNSVRVQVKVSVDGQDATEGTWLVIQPNSSIELERFIKGGNLSRGNRFKFIERTGKVEKHRGVGAEDGLIRIEYQTERVAPKPVHIPVVQYDYYNVYVPWYRPIWWGGTYIWNGVQYVCNNAPASLNGSTTFTTSGAGQTVTFTNSSGLGGAQFCGSLLQKSDADVKCLRSAKPTKGMQVNCLNTVRQADINDAGITVAGSESAQQFHWTAGFPVHETSDVVVLRLRGEVGGKRVAKAVTVKTKPTCATCGKKNRPQVKFCAECGTALVLC